MLNSDFEILQETISIAMHSSCQKAQCGSIIISEGQIIGSGFNSPAGKEVARCNDNYLIPENNKHDITCCVHAEIRAIHNALSSNPEKIKGEKLYFIRLDDSGKPTTAGAPYCTMCSRAALDSGIAEFGLWKQDHFEMYDAQEYNNLSYQFFKDKALWKLK